MADTKISDLTGATDAALANELPINEAGTTKKLTGAQLMRFAGGGFFACLVNDFTLTSQTAIQKIFNVGSGSGGALSLDANCLYMFEMLLNVDTMSATSGNALIDLKGAGSVGIASQLWTAIGLDATALNTAAALSGGLWTAASAGNMVVAATGTAMCLLVKGVLRTSTAGTLIPNIGLTTAAAAVVRKNSYFRIHKIGADTDASFGSWA